MALIVLVDIAETGEPAFVADKCIASRWFLPLLAAFLV
jgi:hypothetical protein